MALKKHIAPDFSVRLHSVTSAVRDDAELLIDLGSREIEVVGTRGFSQKGKQLQLSVGAVRKMKTRLRLADEGFSVDITFDGICEDRAYPFQFTMSPDELSAFLKAIEHEMTNEALCKKYHAHLAQQGCSREDAKEFAHDAYP